MLSLSENISFSIIQEGLILFQQLIRFGLSQKYQIVESPSDKNNKQYGASSVLCRSFEIEILNFLLPTTIPE